MDKAAKMTYVYNHICIVYDASGGAIVMIVEEDQQRLRNYGVCFALA